MGRSLDFVITQTQQINLPLETVADNALGGGDNTFDISSFNHPVKSIFFGYGTSTSNFAGDRFSFTNADLLINGVSFLEKMSPTYFHTVQNYYKSRFGVTDYRVDSEDLMYTRYFVYHFGLNASDYNPSGSCNFSRLDNAKLILRGVEKGVLRADQNEMYLYAVNYNVLRIKDGLAGILFGN